MDHLVDFLPNDHLVDGAGCRKGVLINVGEYSFDTASSGHKADLMFITGIRLLDTGGYDREGCGNSLKQVSGVGRTADMYAVALSGEMPGKPPDGQHFTKRTPAG